MGLAANIVLLGGLASTAAAHGVVSHFLTDGLFNEGWQNQYLKKELAGEPIPNVAAWHAQNLDMGFVSTQHYQTPDIICHKGATPPTNSSTVAAGGTVEFKWNQWVESHMGPVMTYVAACNGDCNTIDKEVLKWVKIDEEGFNAETQEWAAVSMIANDATWVTEVPETLAPGNYVFRHEIIALYGKQHYPQCMTIEITGNGTERPEGVIGTELYRDGVPANEGDPNANPEKYIVPGPPLWTPGSDTAVPIPSESGSASGTGTAGPEETSTSAASEISTAIAEQTSTAAASETSTAGPDETSADSASEVSTAIAEETSTAAASETSTAGLEETSTAAASEISTAIAEQTSTALASETSTAGPEETSAASASEVSTAIAEETSTAAASETASPSGGSKCSLRRRHARQVRI